MSVSKPRLLNLLIAKLIHLIQFCDSHQLPIDKALPELGQTPDGLESLIQMFKSVVHKKHSASLRTYLEFLAERRQDTDTIKSKLQQIAGTAGEPDETH